MKKKIISILKQIIDPEIKINIYDLGLIYKLKYNKNKKKVFILMTLTTPNCPLVNDIVYNIKKYIKKKINFINDIIVKITFKPSWNINMMSDEAKFKLGLF
ncbi:MAG: iron-sulfur cluster assembly protein [Candidatus Shikimatogenerans bostrichidophilus]|nr:MAG: iron-sulfur cluster assembly protein [Candidatus Shikimatogenerans bostrichidophilus]